jgi:hypothetical protein
MSTKSNLNFSVKSLLGCVLRGGCLVSYGSCQTMLPKNYWECLDYE